MKVLSLPSLLLAVLVASKVTRAAITVQEKMRYNTARAACAAMPNGTLWDNVRRMGDVIHEEAGLGNEDYEVFWAPPTTGYRIIRGGYEMARPGRPFTWVRALRIGGVEFPDAKVGLPALEGSTIRATKNSRCIVYRHKPAVKSGYRRTRCLQQFRSICEHN